MKVIYTCLACLIFFNIFGIIFCFATHKVWYNPISLAESSLAGYFFIIFIGAPICLGILLNVLKIQNYKMIDYLKIYFTPKIPLNQNGSAIEIEKER